MRHTTFGSRTGLRVSELALGTAGFNSDLPSGTDRAGSVQMFERFAEAGGTFIDTANSYQETRSETLLGELLGADRDRFVLASKFSLGAGSDHGVTATGNSRKTIMRAVEASLRRLNTDYIDLYWAHFPDEVTPIDELMSAFDDLVRSGKILHAGFSNFPAWRIARGATIAEVRGWAYPVGVQVEYSLAERAPERELVPMAEDLGMGMVAYSPLGGGFLTGKYRTSDAGRLTTLRTIIQTEDNAQKTDVLDLVLAIAEELEVTPAQIAMAWLRARSARSRAPIIPIIGPRTIKHLDDYLGSLEVDLNEAQYTALETASAPALGIPHDTVNERIGVLLGGRPDRFVVRRPRAVPFASKS